MDNQKNTFFIFEHTALWLCLIIVILATNATEKWDETDALFMGLLNIAPIIASVICRALLGNELYTAFFKINYTISAICAVLNLLVCSNESDMLVMSIMIFSWGSFIIGIILFILALIGMLFYCIYRYYKDNAQGIDHTQSIINDVKNKLNNIHFGYWINL